MKSNGFSGKLLGFGALTLITFTKVRVLFFLREVKELLIKPHPSDKTLVMDAASQVTAPKPLRLSLFFGRCSMARSKV
jgi:hypothetical protein